MSPGAHRDTQEYHWASATDLGRFGGPRRHCSKFALRYDKIAMYQVSKCTSSRFEPYLWVNKVYFRGIWLPYRSYKPPSLPIKTHILCVCKISELSLKIGCKINGLQTINFHTLFKLIIPKLEAFWKFMPCIYPIAGEEIKQCTAILWKQLGSHFGSKLQRGG